MADPMGNTKKKVKKRGWGPRNMFSSKTICSCGSNRLVFEIVDHVQHMGCEGMDVELIESDDDGADMGSSKMTLVECRESLKGIWNFLAQDACLGDGDLLQVQQLANKLLAMQATCVMNRKQEVIKEFFPVVGI